MPRLHDLKKEEIQNPKLIERCLTRYSANNLAKIEDGKLYIDGIFASKTKLKKIKQWKITDKKITVFGL